MKSNPIRPLLIATALFACSPTLHAAEITVAAPDSPPLLFALVKLEAALQKQGDSLKRSADSTPGITVTLDPALKTSVGPDGYQRIKAGSGLKVTASDERGAMYAVLDLAEEIRHGTPLHRIAEHTARAELEFRAIKFNLPWSAYRTSPVLEQHQETCKDLKFWEAYLDMMAENRFNVLSFWSMHPYTYMIRPKNFPEACSFNDTEMAEWKTLWTGIFAMAKERGIDTYLLNWNIFVSPEFSKAHNVAPWSVNLSHIGGKDDFTGELVERYTKEVITQLLDEYPDLTGLGITLGERMGGMTPDQRRTWLDQTFFAGIAEAKRPAKFIYRAPLSANTGSGGTTSEENDRLTRSQIESLSKNITGPIYVEFKHNWSHAHSSPDLFHVHGGPLSDAYWNPAPTRHKVVWTMRNEDMFILRWEQPDFVREFVKGVTVNGAFHSNASETISSEDRKTSVVYGTDEQGWSKKRGVKTFTICTFQNFRGLMKISNLTSLNPRGVHVRDSSKVVQGSACEFLDKRDGLGTNSDGFKGGNSSTEISPMRI